MDVAGVSSGHEVQACAARQPHHSRHGVREPAAPPHPAASWPPSCPPDRPPTCPQHTGNEQIGTQGEQADGGRRSVAGWLSPDSAEVGYRSGVPERILRSTWAKRCPPSVAWTRRRRAPAAPNRPARSASLVAQRGQPAAPAARASSGAARGVCCLPSGTPKSRASRSVPPFPCTAHTHISAEHESARSSPQRRPGGTAPAASRCT